MCYFDIGQKKVQSKCQNVKFFISATFVILYVFYVEQTSWINPSSRNFFKKHISLVAVKLIHIKKITEVPDRG